MLSTLYLELLSKVNELKRQVKQVQIAIQTLTGQDISVDTNLVELLNELPNRIEAIETQIRQVLEFRQNIAQTVNSLTEQVMEISEKVEPLRQLAQVLDDIQELKGQNLTELQDSIMSLEQNLVDLQNTFSTLQSDHNTLRSDYSAFKTTITNRINELIALQNDYNVLKNDYTTFKTTITNSLSEFVQLSDIEDILNQIAQLNNIKLNRDLSNIDSVAYANLINTVAQAAKSSRIINATTLSENYLLKPGETAYITFRGTANFDVRIDIEAPAVYQYVCIYAGQGASTSLYPNYINYGSIFRYGYVRHVTSAINNVPTTTSSGYKSASAFVLSVDVNGVSTGIIVNTDISQSVFFYSVGQVYGTGQFATTFGHSFCASSIQWTSLGRLSVANTNTTVIFVITRIM